MADLMTVAKALAFVDELVLLDDDCTRPELAMRVLAAEVRRLQAGHCKDCCCARAWKALTIDQCTGKSIPEHIEALKAEVERLSRGTRTGRPEMTDDPIFTADDMTQAESYKVLGPAYFAARRLSEAMFAGVESDDFSPVIEKISKKLRDGLYDYATEWMANDLREHIQSVVRRMVDDTVTALLAGAPWAIERYLLAPWGDGERIRKGIATHCGESVLKLRVEELEKENARLQELWACHR